MDLEEVVVVSLGAGNRGISGFIGLDYLGFILNCLREGI
jgi:hypothetical protein